MVGKQGLVEHQGKQDPQAGVGVVLEDAEQGCSQTDSDLLEQKKGALAQSKDSLHEHVPLLPSPHQMNKGEMCVQQAEKEE